MHWIYEHREPLHRFHLGLIGHSLWWIYIECCRCRIFEIDLNLEIRKWMKMEKIYNFYVTNSISALALLVIYFPKERQRKKVSKWLGPTAFRNAHIIYEVIHERSFLPISISISISLWTLSCNPKPFPRMHWQNRQFRFGRCKQIY